MKVLLLGANGQVGHELRRSLSRIGTVIASTRAGVLEDGTECELADLDRPDSLPALLDRISPDIVVNAAAYTAVDRAEDEPVAAFRINAEAPGRLAEACAAREAVLVHYSTDYVFNGGATRPYREDDATDPLGIYGASKLAGEKAIRESGCRHMIFRTAWVYGNHGSNFMRTMLRLAAEREQLSVVADQVGTPTPANLVADVTAAALESGMTRSGLWHLTASGETNWYIFATEILLQASARGLLARLPEVVPITAAEYPTRARRPAYSCLDTSQLQMDFGLVLPDWRQALTGILESARH
ncbi:MAG: dTDP-4-dehydrorhamnose reductase [Pseudoxanthomonas sp.]